MKFESLIDEFTKVLGRELTQNEYNRFLWIYQMGTKEDYEKAIKLLSDMQNI